MTTAETEPSGYCPHCQLLVETSVVPAWPQEPVRCPHCHLLIGIGRGQSEPSGEPGTKGTAAGVFSREAKRGGQESGVSPEEALEGIRAAARMLGEAPERLLMVDYQQMAATNEGLPQLRDIFAAFGSWKRARREAASELAPTEDG